MLSELNMLTVGSDVSEPRGFIFCLVSLWVVYIV